MIPIRLYAYAAIAAAIGLLLWHDHWISRKYKAAHAEASQLTATLTAERANRKIEQDDRRRADASVKSLEAQLASINQPSKPVSVFCRPARVSAASESGTAAEPSSAATGDGAAEPLRDIGAAVEAVRIEQQSNAARQRALIEWELARTH
jgi:hypothetical protein